MNNNDITLPELPNGWVWTRLGEIIDVIRGASPRPKGDPRYFGGRIPWIMISDVSKEKGKYLSKTRDSVTEDGAKKSRHLKAGTLILSNSGTVCVPKILAVDGCIHDGFVAFPNLKNDTDILYLYYYFEKIRPKIIQENKQGVTQVNLNTKIVKDIVFPLPPLPEQHRIVARIEELFTNLDAGVESLKAARTQLKRYRQSVLKSACEGKLVPTEAELARAEGREYEPAEVLLERILEERRRKWDENYKGKKYKEPVVPDTSLWPELPEGWDWVAVEQLAQVGTGATPLKSKNEYYKNGSIPWITSGALNKLYISKPSDLVTEKALQETNLTLYPEHTLLVAMYGEGKTRGKCSELLIEATTNQAIAALVLEDTFSALRSFLKIFLVKNYDDTRRKSSGGVQPNLNLGLIKKIKIPLPPLAEQHRIVAEVERRLSVADEMEKTIEHSLKQAERLRQSILKRAFEGKLVPQDPEDEPARVLLERIRREKEIHEKNNKSKTRKNRGNKALTKAELERFREADKQAADYIEKVDASHKWAT